MVNRVMVQPNPTRDNTVRVSCRLIGLLLREGFEVLALEGFRELLQAGLSADQAVRVRFLGEPDIYPACDFIMVVGGDGTILRTAGQASLYR